MSYSLADIWRDRLLLRSLYRGWRHFAASGETPADAYQSMVSLHCRSNGLTTDILAEIVRRFRRPLPLDPCEGVLGTMSDEGRMAAMARLRNDGFVILDATLPTSVCIELKRFAETTPAELDSESGNASETAIYDRSAPRARRYQFSEPALIALPAVQRLMGDQSLLAFSQSYFGAAPIFDFATMWWSTTFSSEPGSTAAQLFHFDFDRIKWLKWFFYLTDVTEERGPHCYVRGSHRRGISQAAPLLARGYARLTDKEVVDAFGSESIASIVGRAGTIIAVDTRGFHKGVVPLRGDRLVLQFQFATSDFGGHVPRTPLGPPIIPELQEMLEKHPSIFRRYLAGGGAAA
jgi:hypothetical protein